MSEDVFTREHFHRFLRKRWKENGISLAKGKRVGISIDELVKHSANRNAKLKLPFVDLWVAVLDECISWTISLATVVYGDRAADKGLSDFEKALTLIIAKVIADSTSIRHLILLGFDTSARAVLRSVSEYMEVLVAIIHKPEFSTDFLASDTPDAAQRFWEQHLRGGKIRRKVEAAWADFFKEEGDEAAKWFANWGRGSHPVLSGTAHPSYAGGLFAAIPLNGKYEDENWLGFWGSKADTSVETVFIYVQFMFPILLLSRGFPFEGSEPYIHRPYDEKNELHRHVKVGGDILASVILSLGSQENTQYLFPDLDVSIYGGDRDS